MNSGSSLCDDISEFMEAMKIMRVLDDKIVHALNTTIPSESFSYKIDARATCKDLFIQLVDNHTKRDKTLQHCLNTTANQIQKLRADRDTTPNDTQILKRLRKEQGKLRELQTEINVEEVIRGRTLKLYHERCRSFYKPPSTTGNEEVVHRNQSSGGSTLEH